MLTKLIKWFKHTINTITIEPVIFFYLIGTHILLGAQIPTNILMYKICRFEEGFDDEVCNNLGDPANEDVQENVQIR